LERRPLTSPVRMPTRRRRAADAPEDGLAEEALAEVGDDRGLAALCGLGGEIDEVVLLVCVEDDGFEEVELDDLLSADEEALLLAERAVDREGADLDAVGGEPGAEGG